MSFSIAMVAALSAACTVGIAAEEPAAGPDGGASSGDDASSSGDDASPPELGSVTYGAAGSYCNFIHPCNSPLICYMSTVSVTNNGGVPQAALATPVCADPGRGPEHRSIQYGTPLTTLTDGSPGTSCGYGIYDRCQSGYVCVPSTVHVDTTNRDIPHIPTSATLDGWVCANPYTGPYHAGTQRTVFTASTSGIGGTSCGYGVASHRCNVGFQCEPTAISLSYQSPYTMTLDNWLCSKPGDGPSQ